MEKIKKYWREIVIALLVLFSLSKCTQSCTNNRKYENEKVANKEIVAKNDSVVKVLNDSIAHLNTTIQIYKEKVSGLNKAINIQEEASKRISEAKKNISVTVREKKD